MTNSDFKLRLSEARQKALNAQTLAKQKEDEWRRSRDEAEKQKTLSEQQEILKTIEKIIADLEEVAKKGWFKVKVDLPLKGHEKDFKYNQGCQPDFIFQPNSFTSKIIKTLKEDLCLIVEPKLYTHTDNWGDSEDNYWLDVNF